MRCKFPNGNTVTNGGLTDRGSPPGQAEDGHRYALSRTS